MTLLPTPFDAGAVSPSSAHDASTGVPDRYRRIPPEMRDTPCWMVARDKEPYSVTPNALMQGKVVVSDFHVNAHNPANHCTFDMAVQAVKADATLALGFMMGVGNDLACIDTDDPGKARPEHQDEVREQQRLIRGHFGPKTYSEVSQSGNGHHFIGRWSSAPAGLKRKKQAKFQVELLVQQFVVITGTQPEDENTTTDIGDISSDCMAMYRKMMADESQDWRSDAAPTVAASITPAQCSEKRLISRLGGDWELGPAFHDGNKAPDWSDALFGFCCSAAQITTDHDLVYRIIARSGFVLRADDKGSESRPEKLARTFNDTWHKALIKTEPSRQKSASSSDDEIDFDREYSRADLWQDEHKAVLNQYVIHLVRKEAERMIRDELHSNSSAEVIAPLFLYISERERGTLANHYAKVEQHELASACTDAQIKALRLGEDVSVPHLDQYICQAVKWVHRDRSFEYLKDWFDARFYIVKNHFGKAVVFQVDDPDAPEQLLSDFQKAFSEYVYYGDIDHKKDEIEIKAFVAAWISTAGGHQYISARMMYETAEPSVNTSTGRVKNLFTGFATNAAIDVLESANDWPLISAHLWYVICAEDGPKADYLIKYLAHLVQRPWELPKAAIAIYSSEQGSGKSLLFNMVKELVGAKYCFETNDPNHIFGRFTDGMMEKLVVHGAEMLAAADDASNARAKNIITDPTIAIEGKFKRVSTAKNYTRLFITTNKPHAVQVEASDRRFLVLRASPIYGPTHEFWNRYWPNDQTQHRGYRGELSAFMRFLLGLDISTFNPRDIPQTVEKGEQKLLSLIGANQILFTILSEGQLPIWSEQQASSAHGGVWVTPISEWKRWLKLQPTIKAVPAQVGTIFKAITDGANRTMRMSIGGIEKGQLPGTYHCTCLPPLADARRRFLDHLNIEHYNWDDGPEVDWVRG